MKMKKGGLINDLEHKIKEYQNLLGHYEKKILSLENDISQLQFEYNQSFKVFTQPFEYEPNNEWLLDYRQSILNQMLNLNNYILELNDTKCKWEKECNFLNRLYLYLN